MRASLNTTYVRKRALIFIAVVVAYWWFFPTTLFDEPTATLILDSRGQLLSAKIAEDAQWRFPEVDSIPANLEAAILTFEDEYFRWHPGVNPISSVRALWQNLVAGETVRGGSTLSMQVIRLSRKGQGRTIAEKLIEMYMAVRLEFGYSKDEILRLYASYAPYGGNVVGVEAASWRYFNRPPSELSWAEVSTLAVLPNAPSLVHPGRNREVLRSKRDRLLAKLYEHGKMDSTTYSLALMEPVPDAPHPLPADAAHLLGFAHSSNLGGQRVKTTIDGSLQHRVNQRLNQYARNLEYNGVHNACALVVDLNSGAVLAYVGNASTENTRSPYVDIIRSPRSSGSILKPFLYGAAIEHGMIHTSSLLRDVPTTIGKFSPENFDKNFEGVVAAGDALARSLNVPATLLLRDYGVAPFLADLNQLGFSTINRSADDYGLSLTLGGAEVTLWDLAQVYAAQAMALKRPDSASPQGLHLWGSNHFGNSSKLIDRGAWWLISEALCEVNRPDLSESWRRFSSSRKIAWKTGTSQGFRDAWAIGYDGDFLVAVWVGNADGEGRPGLTGVSVAAPLMFEVFQFLAEPTWFAKPEGYLRSVNLCANSGMAATQICPTKAADMPLHAKMPLPCQYHESIYLNEQGKRAFLGCAQHELRDTTWFALDAVAGYFYAKKSPSYKPLPPTDEGCAAQDANAPLAIIYPSDGAQILLPINFQGRHENLQFKAAHNSHHSILYWHLNGRYIGSTSGTHQLSADVEVGDQVLKIIDGQGNEASIRFHLQKDQF